MSSVNNIYLVPNLSQFEEYKMYKRLSDSKYEKLLSYDTSFYDFKNGDNQSFLDSPTLNTPKIDKNDRI